MSVRLVDIFGALYLLGSTYSGEPITVAVLGRGHAGSTRAAAGFGQYEIPKSRTLIEKLAAAARERKKGWPASGIAMNDAQAMGIGHCDASLQNELDRLVDGQRTSISQPSRKIAPSRNSITKVGSPVVQRADVEDSRDVLAIELDGPPGLGGKAQEIGLAV